MIESDNGQTKVTLAAAGFAGVVAFAIFLLVMGYDTWPSAFLALLVAVLVALMFWIASSRGNASAPAAAPEPVEAEPAAAPAARTVKPGPEHSVSGIMGEAGARLKKSAATAARPEGMESPRVGGADDLKKIKGVGEKLEEMLHELGYFHFDQISNWSAAEVAWVDENLPGFRGRVSRDDWVAQAKVLAEGGETEFSKRVSDGDVY